jgi:serine/threonine-protein kinase PknG
VGSVLSASVSVAASSLPVPPGRAPSATTQVRRTTGRTTRTAVSRLGVGIVDVPQILEREPSSAVIADPHVSESRRFCGSCGEQVGRGRNGLPGRTEGFCRKCGHPFVFTPKLGPGDLVGEQYEVVGCLAHGGLGWIYLAKDRHVHDRWVVLKGILNAGDRDAMAAAVAERRFLAEVEHPNIVKILNFVEHDGAGYIVMEYVGGTSLRELLVSRRAANGDRPDPLPVAQAIAYMLEVLPAFGYLHRNGLLFCDFKPDNVIQTEHSLKLIDLGGVYRISEASGAVYGTVGYQAPEIAEMGPSVPSDLFTVARTLAALSVDLRSMQSTFKFTLPSPDTVEAFARYDSFYRFLLKGTSPHPDDRFQSADEMAEQLMGVLREVVAADGNPSTGAPSTVFTGDLRADPDSPDWARLPRLRVPSDDPASDFLANITAAEPREILAELDASPVDSVEISLARAMPLIELGEWDELGELLASIEDGDPWEWRAAWCRGVGMLARGEHASAGNEFAVCYQAVPGELAPKLALGVAAELDARPEDAAGWYEVVSRTDPTMTNATFGLARCCLEMGDKARALAAYDRVPDSSSSYLNAQVARTKAALDPEGPCPPESDDVTDAARAIDRLPLDAAQRAELLCHLFDTALALLHDGTISPDGGVVVADHPLTETGLRSGLEDSYRALARVTADPADRIPLVDLANRVRPRTWT